MYQPSDIENIETGLPAYLKGEYLELPEHKPSPYQQSIIPDLLGKFVKSCCCQPYQTCCFISVFIGQLSSPCCLSIMGNEWCYNPSQNPYSHTLYVIRNTLLGWYRRWCCGLNESVGVFLGSAFIPSPPPFIFNEKLDEPQLLSFDNYVKQVDNAPPYSGRYRAIDGGGNRKKYTFLGQGGRGYSQTLPFSVLSVLPDANQLAKRLLTRQQFHPAIHDTNSLATWLANVAIHELFRSGNNTKRYGFDRPWVNMHSSYLDLQVLYGYNQATMEKTRSYQDGKLKSYAEDRLNRIPESLAIIELLRREHNWVCDQLKKRYPYNFNKDEELYQQARLIMGGVFINIILRSYGCMIFGENAPNGFGAWELRQRYQGDQIGNHNGLNFNLLYQWHNTIPKEWDPKNIPSIDKDDDLRKVFGNMLKWRSGAFGAHNTPPFLVPISAKLIETARRCGSPRFNDFRRRFASPYRSFEEMCGNSETARQLQEFYPTIEDVELVVGVQVEKPSTHGWGLPETVATAIISDAFSTIINDRFYTDDYTPEKYTPWGFQHTQTTILADLLNRHLQLGIDRNMPLEKLSSWKPPSF